MKKKKSYREFYDMIMETFHDMKTHKIVYSLLSATILTVEDLDCDIKTITRIDPNAVDVEIDFGDHHDNCIDYITLSIGYIKIYCNSFYFKENAVKHLVPAITLHFKDGTKYGMYLDTSKPLSKSTPVLTETDIRMGKCQFGYSNDNLMYNSELQFHCPVFITPDNDDDDFDYTPSYVVNRFIDKKFEIIPDLLLRISGFIHFDIMFEMNDHNNPSDNN